MERHCANAMKVAQFLELHPKVKWTNYPGPKSSNSITDASRRST
jgi:O-acetylhomoserine/O-acetylserine sulfhydrylase-like pyridoxal-dependent enzyme